MIDIKEAEKHLNLLDPLAIDFTFQTYDDNADRNDKYLSHILHGCLDEHADQLAEFNKRGAAVSVVANTTDLKGRRKENIVEVRAFWIEDDHNSNIALPIPPSFVVESSPNKFHKYFLVHGFSVDELAPIQRRLIDDYGSDPNAGDISRVLRLAGFAHQKVNTKKGLTGKAFTVRIVQS